MIRPVARPLDWLAGELFPRAHRSPLQWVAGLLSRVYLPRADRLILWPDRTGLVRAAGKWFVVFYAAACLLVLSSAYLACKWVKSKVAAGTADPSPESLKADPFSEQVNSLLLQFVDVVRSPSPWLWLVGSLAVFTALSVTHRAWGANGTLFRLGRRLTLLGWFLLLPLAVVVTLAGQIAVMASAGVAVVATMDLAFPGLFGNGDIRSVVPWEVWFVLVSALLVYRGSTAHNPRLREFTNLVRWTDSPTLVLDPYTVLAEYLPPIRDAAKPTARGLSSLEELRMHQTKLRTVELYLAFYEREGLNDLFNMENPERRFYTDAQRAEFHRCYSKIQYAVSSQERRINWIMGDLQKETQVAETAPPA